MTADMEEAPRTRIVDCVGLDPPQPLERVLDAISNLPPDEQVLMRIGREPRPLYRILQDSGFVYRTTYNEQGWFEVLIWRAS